MPASLYNWQAVHQQEHPWKIRSVRFLGQLVWPLCRRNATRIAALYSMYDSTKLLVISITVDTKKEDFQTAADRLHMTWP